MGINDELRARNRAGTRIRLRTAAVLRSRPLTPRMHRITLAGPELAGFEQAMLPADSIKLALRPAGEPGPTVFKDGLFTDGVRPAFRVYSVRRFDPVTTELDLDLVLHDGGPGVEWVRSATPGDPVSFVGPRSEFVAAPDAQAQLLVGDETAVPAVAAILESLPPGQPVRVVLAVPGPEYVLPLGHQGAAEVTWLEAGTPEALVKVVRELEVPAGVQAWVAAEARVVRSMREVLRETVEPADLHAVGYWRQGMTLTETDAAKLAIFDAAAKAGRPYEDHHDIDVADLDEHLSTSSPGG